MGTEPFVARWPDGRQVPVRLQALGKSGGAGEVFSLADDATLVAKLYHDSIQPEQLRQYERKIAWMMDHVPVLPPAGDRAERIVQLAWPLAQVLRNGRFAGFLMEKVDFERTIELDYLLTHRQAEREGFAVDMGKLIAVCFNLASVLNSLHHSGIFVVDLKPVNIKVYKQALYVAILDCDGFQITHREFQCDAPQVTPEYLAPECQRGAVTQPRAQDCFALATIIFRLLNFGIHPYSGIATGGHGLPVELAARIRDRLFAYGTQAHPRIRPVPASAHLCLPPVLRQHFDSAFSADAAKRPTAGQWVDTLQFFARRDMGALVACAQGHLHFPPLPCPMCLRGQLLQGHALRRQRFVARMQRSPARVARYVRNAIRGTQVSPFQAALAQAQWQPVQVQASVLPLRQAFSVEIAWLAGLAVSIWWLL